VALDLIAFPRGAAQGAVNPDVIWDLGFLYGPVLMGFYFLALASIGFYRITRHGHNERVNVLRKDAAGTPVPD